MRIFNFQHINNQRSLNWHGAKKWTLSDWGVAMAGECGEACNVIKKLNRERDHIAGNSETTDELFELLGEELADTVMYAFLLASAARIDMESALIKKFNKTSEKIGSDYFIQQETAP